MKHYAEGERLPEVLEIDCPVCGTTLDYKFRRSSWYGECPKCRTRIYTHPADMERVMPNASKNKAPS